MRKGARRIAEIPADVLRDLNAGRIETRTLVEWLAIDMPTLLRSALPEAGLGKEAASLAAKAGEREGVGIMQRMHATGVDLLHALRGRQRLFARVASHRSDMVRAFAAYALRADPSLALAERLARLRPFAADSSMAVRESAWDALRPHLAADLAAALPLLGDWVVDPDAHVRRCAIEATRPRGVWCRHLEELKRAPERGLPLLEPVRSDASRYVLTSASNWLNDASKSVPKWVASVCRRWERESRTPETQWLVRRALRTIAKVGFRPLARGPAGANRP